MLTLKLKYQLSTRRHSPVGNGMYLWLLSCQRSIHHILTTYHTTSLFINLAVYQCWAWKRKSSWKCSLDNIHTCFLKNKKFLIISSHALLSYCKTLNVKMNGNWSSVRHSNKKINSDYWQKESTHWYGIHARIWKRTKMEITSHLWYGLSFNHLTKMKNLMVTKLNILNVF